MPKQVHEIVYTLWLNKWLNNMKFTCCSRWAYSDPAEFMWSDMEFKTFDSIWDWLYRNSMFWDAHTDYTLFKKRKQIVTYKGNVTARNFKSASITAKVNIIKEPCIKELMNQLSAREFVQFMSDNIGEVLTDDVAQEK